MRVPPEYQLPARCGVHIDSIRREWTEMARVYGDPSTSNCMNEATRRVFVGRLLQGVAAPFGDVLIELEKEMAGSISCTPAWFTRLWAFTSLW